MNILEIASPKIDTNLDQEALFNFLDHVVLQLTQVKNAEEVDLIMDDFMSNDFLDILSGNKEFFSLLNVIWFNTFKRVFIDERSDSFPLKVLLLPVLFKQLGWEIEDIETFEEANYKFRSQTAFKNDLYKLLVELFLNGLKFDTKTSFNLFKKKVESLEMSESDKENIPKMLQDIESLGW